MKKTSRQTKILKLLFLILMCFLPINIIKHKLSKNFLKNKLWDLLKRTSPDVNYNRKYPTTTSYTYLLIYSRIIRCFFQPSNSYEYMNSGQLIIALTFLSLICLICRYYITNRQTQVFRNEVRNTHIVRIVFYFVYLVRISRRARIRIMLIQNNFYLKYYRI